MGYRLPDEDRLVDAIEEALVRHPIVASQRALGEHVRSILHQEDEAFRVSDRRVRRVAVDASLADVRVETGTTDEEPREECPVCGNPLEPVKNRTLEGGETVVGTRCQGCPYSTGTHHEVPLQYEFARAEDPSPDRRGPF